MSRYFDLEYVDPDLLYAGIGSRKVPRPVGLKMTRCAGVLEELGFWQLSGGAPGSDDYFESGCRNHTSLVPWNGFEKRRMLHRIPDEAFEITAPFHPYWNKMSQGVRKMMARNAMQVLGPWLNTPVQFVLCWTPDGCIGKATRDINVTGGTGQAIVIAEHYGIPVINMQTPGWSGVLSELLDHDLQYIERGDL